MRHRPDVERDHQHRRPAFCRYLHAKFLCRRTQDRESAIAGLAQFCAGGERNPASNMAE
jgi:hypothetical protein